MGGKRGGTILKIFYLNVEEDEGLEAWMLVEFLFTNEIHYLSSIFYFRFVKGFRNVFGNIWMHSILDLLL